MQMNRFKLNSQARKRIALILVLSLALSLPLSGAALGAPPRETNEVEGGVQRIWALERVDAPQAYSNLTQRSLRVDSNNYPRVAYGGDHLYYARYDGNTWNITTVDGSFGGPVRPVGPDRTATRTSPTTMPERRLEIRLYSNNQWIVQTVDGSQAFCCRQGHWGPKKTPTGRIHPRDLVSPAPGRIRLFSGWDGLGPLSGRRPRWA
jgi:hypothetical protein